MDIALAVNRRPGRLWAFLQFPLTRIVLAVLALAVVIGAIQVGSKAAGIVPRTPPGALVAVLIMIATLATYAAFVRGSAQYGTRASTLAYLSNDGGAGVHERTLGADVRREGEVEWHIARAGVRWEEKTTRDSR